MVGALSVVVFTLCGVARAEEAPAGNPQVDTSSTDEGQSLALGPALRALVDDAVQVPTPETMTAQARLLARRPTLARDVALFFEHRGADHFFIRERLDDNGDPLGPLDNTAWGIQIGVPRLSDIARRRAFDARLAATEATTKAGLAARAEALCALVVAAIGSREQARLAEGLVADAATAWERAMAGQASAAVLAEEVDDAAAALAKAAQTHGRAITDRADADIALEAAGIDVSRFDALWRRGGARWGPWLRARCLAPAVDDTKQGSTPPAPTATMEAALQADVDAAWLARVPWPNQLQAAWIERGVTDVDDLRLKLDLTLPVQAWLSDDVDTSTRALAAARAQQQLDVATETRRREGTASAHAALEAAVARLPVVRETVSADAPWSARLARANRRRAQLTLETSCAVARGGVFVATE